MMEGGRAPDYTQPRHDPEFKHDLGKSRMKGGKHYSWQAKAYVLYGAELSYKYRAWLHILALACLVFFLYSRFELDLIFTTILSILTCFFISRCI